MFRTLGIIGGAMVAGDLFPLLAEAAKRKQVLRVAVDRDFETLRPDFSAGYNNNMLKRLIYTTPVLWGTKPRPDGSLTYDPDTIEGRLVIAHKVSEDRQTIEFTLRPDAKFANGDHIDAQALKDSYTMHITNRGPGASQLKVSGLPSADRIEVIDDVTLRLSLDRPVAWGVSSHSLHNGGSVVHAKEILRHATPDDPTGLKWLETKTVESGPFVIESWKKGTMMSLVPNPHSFEPPKLERIILQIIPDPSTRRIMLERGDVEFAMQIATKDIPDLRKVSSVKVTSYPSARGWWLGMTWCKEPFNDPHFRRAIAWAIPYDTLLQVVTRGLAERSRSCVPNNINGYVGDLWPSETNVKNAREELLQARVPDGFSVTMPVNAGDLFDEESTVLIKESLGQLGILVFVIKRLLWMVPTLLGVSVIMFCLTILIPGDPALLRLGNFATVEQLWQLHIEMGLDKPPLERYWLYLKGMVQGDLGRSWRTGDTVTNDLKARFPATLELGLYSAILSILLGIPLGVVTAARKDSYLDYGGKLYGVLGVAMPLFWLGLILVYVFYYLLGIVPAPTGRIDMLIDPPPHLTGLYVVDNMLAGDMEALWSSIGHLVLPVMTLTFIVGASIARMTYTSMRRVLSAPYILVGHAYGIAPSRLIYKYALKNALMPVITFVGLQIGFLIGGVVLVEVVFALPGIGRYAVDSLLVNDFAPVQGFVLVVLTVYLCVNLLADVLYGLVNPQVRAAMEGV